MAFSQSIRKGQVLICCDLCETETKINWKCLNCDMLMCTKCKDNKHSRFGRNHQVIDIKEVMEVGRHTEEVDLSDIKCRKHQDQQCVIFCKSCDSLVCPTCIAKIHNGHELVEISEVFKIRKTKLKDVLYKLQQQIDEMKKKDAVLKNTEKTEKTIREETERKIEKQKIVLKKSVDDYIAELKKELSQKWEVLQKSVNQERQKLGQRIEKMELQKAEIEQIMNSKDTKKIFEEYNLESSVDLKVEPSQRKFDSMPTFLPGEISKYNVGSLQQNTDKIEVKVIKQLKTEITRVYFLSTCPDNSLWIADDKVLQKVKIDGQRISVISSFNLDIYDVSITSSGDVIIASRSVVKTVSSKTCKLQDSIYSVDPLILTAVHMTEDDKVIVGAKTPGEAYSTTGRRAVIVMNKDGEQEAVYEHDRHDNRIFTYVNFLTTTKNSNIFAVDRFSKDHTGRVVVLDQRGDILQIYTGHPDINTKDKPFKPKGIVTTPSDNVIVTNLNVNILHILNNTGQLVTHFNMKNIGIIHPFSLAYKTTGKLYIGCTASVNSTEKGNIYEVKIDI